MVILKFCDEGQNTATITFNGIDYTTNSPPLFIDYNPIYKEVRGGTGDSNTWQVIYRYTEGTVLGYFIDFVLIYRYFPEGINSNIPSNIQYSTIVKEIPFISGYNDGVFVYYDGFFKAYDNAGITILEATGINAGSNYKIKCDGCRPGECKGKQSKYPGYVCIDCKRIKQGLTNIRSKLNEFK